MNDRKIKLIALDLDGTTLNDQGEFATRTIKAFKKAMEKGAHIVISTGRTFRSLPGGLFEIEGLEYVITSNGALITRLDSMDKLYENYLPAHAVERLISMFKANKVSVETFVDGRAYIDRAEYDEMAVHGSTFRDVEYVLRTRNPIANIFSFMISHRDKIENISLNFQLDQTKREWEKSLDMVEDITVTSSFAHNLEIGGKNTSKGEALRVLMKQLDIQAEEMLACGDSPNDRQMLELAGIGVAVGNASKEIKVLADYITDPNHEDGVAKAIEKFVL